MKSAILNFFKKRKEKSIPGIDYFLWYKLSCLDLINLKNIINNVEQVSNLLIAFHQRTWNKKNLKLIEWVKYKIFSLDLYEMYRAKKKVKKIVKLKLIQILFISDRNIHFIYLEESPPFLLEIIWNNKKYNIKKRKKFLV